MNNTPNTNKIDKTTRDKAMRAFKRKLESYNLESSQYNSQITAIEPPNQFPQEVWDRLVELGKLKKIKNNLYALASTK